VSEPLCTIMRALGDPELFQPLFKAPSWDRWKVFLSALFGLPLDKKALEVFRHHTERTTAPTSPFREAALVCGRRSGKSRMLALIAVYLACFRDYSEYLAPGETPIVAIIAADRKQARVILRYIVGLLRNIKLLAPLIDMEYADSVRLTNGVTIEVHTGSIASPRGRPFIAVLADEIAFWSAEGTANPDTEVISAVRPGLLSIPGSMLLLASSPYSKRGVLWETYRHYFGRDDARTLVWRAATLEMNPSADADQIAEEYEADEEAASAEYGGQFRSDLASFIDAEVVRSLVIPSRFELPALAVVEYRAFVDPSGGAGDSMTLAIAHRDSEGNGILDAIRERRPPFSPESVVKEFADTLRSYRISRVTGDYYGGEWPGERFAAHQISYDRADKNVSQIYGELLPLLNSAQVELLDNNRLTSQLVSLERRTGRVGRDTISHPPGGHDDVANSVAGVLVQVAGRLSAGERLNRFLGELT
jgi:hypothetical protein